MFAITTRDATPHEKPEKEAIHSGHFMVSHFEAEAQDDEDEIAIPIPEVGDDRVDNLKEAAAVFGTKTKNSQQPINQQQLAIDTSLSKLFQCMSLAYRQKLTSPKWNRFRGVRLRWKDKIRLNNVIWRCWHMQFIKKINTLICPFASPLDVDTHNKPEAVVLEGKYWKRKLAAVTAEYKKWRMYYRNHILGHPKDIAETMCDIESLTWHSQSSENMYMMVDEDYMSLMSDTLFSTISNQPFVFPDSREIAKAGLADFIQPSLGPLQPNLDDYMDTFEPLQEFMSGKLPTVPEEHGADGMYKNQDNWCYPDLDLMTANSNVQMITLQNSSQMLEQYQPSQTAVEKQVQVQDTRPPLTSYTNEILIQSPLDTFVSRQSQPPTYQSSVISKSSEQLKNMPSTQVKMEQAQIQPSLYTKPIDTVYTNYGVGNANSNLCNMKNHLQIQDHPPHPDDQTFKIPHIADPTHASQGYKFPSLPSTAPNVKFASQIPNNYKVPPQSHLQNPTPSINPTLDTPVIRKEDKPEPRIRHRGRQRSTSTTREPIKRPPLISAISDPSLVTSSNSVLLTQLLTNSTSTTNVFAQNPTMNSCNTGHDSQVNSVRIKEENNLPLLSHSASAPTTLIITTPLNMNSVQNPTSDTLLNSLSASSSPINSQNLGSPTSSQGSIGSPNQDTCQKDQRRVGHIHAEQKRRYNIKNGFDMIHSLIPHLNQNPNAKLSKAAMLQKGAEYIRQLRTERNQIKEEMESLQQQIETLNTSISNCQSMLPATGAPVSRRRDSKMQEMFDEYVRKRTMENWKFWIFSLLFKPLLATFNSFVSTSSLDELYRSTMLWIEQHCTLVDLRPAVLNSLRYLCTKTDILSNPEKLPEEARQVALSSNNNQNQL